jgi:carboxyl-terminal processing protease
MKNTLLILIALIISSCTQQPTIIHSNKKGIKLLVNGQSIDWRIEPDKKVDRLEVYCSNPTNKVIFQTDVDTAIFSVGEKDTVKFRIIINKTDTANTEIVGVKALPCKLSNYDKLYWFSQIWSEIKYNFVNIDRLNFNLDSLYKSFIPIVLSSKNDFDYFKVLQQFMATLHDGHSEVSWRTAPFTDYIPMILQDFDRKVYVTSIRKSPEYDSSWIGAEVIEINGLPTSEYLEEKVFPYISASTEQHLWMQSMRNLMSDYKDSPFIATIKKRDGNTEKIIIPRNGEATRTNKDQNWGPERKYSSNVVDFKWLENDIAFLKVNRFQPEQRAIKELDNAFKSIENAKGLIIDLRQNGGGSTLVAFALQKYLTKDKSFLNYAWESRISDGVRRANGNWQDEYKAYYLNKAYRFENPISISVQDSIKRIKCKTVLLIGRYTFSAAEDFLVNIYEVHDRPILIGEETGGSTGSPLLIPGFPGGYAKICTRRICYPISGKRFVNEGIKPDIEVKETIEDYLSSNDPVLKTAINELNN